MARLCPFGPQSETFVEVTPGSSAVRIGKLLEGAGDRAQPICLRPGALRGSVERCGRASTGLIIRRRWSMSTPDPRGDVFTVAVTMPEGSNMFDIAARLEQAGFGSQQQFLDEQPSADTWWRISTRREEPGGISVSGHLSLCAQGHSGTDHRGDGETLQAGSRAGWIEGERA